MWITIKQWSQRTNGNAQYGWHIALLEVCEMFRVSGVSMTQVAVSILQVRCKAVKVVQFSVFT